ncbi:unnamed protein product, partial [Didymodactylos carnosus]
MATLSFKDRCGTPPAGGVGT